MRDAVNQNQEAPFPEPRAGEGFAAPLGLLAAEKRPLQQLWGRRLLPGGCAFFLPNPTQPPWSLGLVCQEPREPHLWCQYLGWCQAPQSFQGRTELPLFHLVPHRETAGKHQP